MTSSIHQRANTKRSLRFGYALFGLLAIFAAAPANAFVNDFSIFNTLSFSPDIGLGVKVKYTTTDLGATGNLEVTNTESFGILDVSGNQSVVEVSGFSLTASLTNGAVNSGSFSLNGSIPGLGGTLENDGLLLSGTVSGFGSSQSQAAFKFLFNNLDGNAHTQGIFGNSTAILINSLTQYAANGFGESWTVNDTTADISPAAVPEPSTLLLMLSGAAVMGYQKRRTPNKKAS